MPEIPKGQKIEVVSNAPKLRHCDHGIQNHRSADSARSVTQLQQFLRISTKRRRCVCATGVRHQTLDGCSRGLVNKPTVFDLDELLKIDHEERVYRLRCVEGWSMVNSVDWFSTGQNY